MNVLKWAETAPYGQKLIYYSEFELTGWDPTRRAYVLGLALKAHDQGLVCLVQRRVKRGRARGTMQYEAHRISQATAIKLGLIKRPVQPLPKYARPRL